MAYPPALVPGETSRTTRTTALGTQFTEIKMNLNGDRCIIHVPAHYESPAEPTVFIALHGHGGSEGTIEGEAIRPRREHYLDLGHIWASSDAHGNAWANDAGQQAYVDLADFIDEYVIDSTNQVLHGASMGGLTAALIYANDMLPKVRCVAVIDGALNLAYAHGKAAYLPAIRAAYGIASDGSDYATKTVGHDAVLLAPAMFTGKHLFLSASYADTAIEQADNTDLFRTNMAGGPATMSFLQTTAGHVEPGNFPLTPFVTFVDTILGWLIPVPPIVTVPDGAFEGHLYTWAAGTAIRVDPRVAFS